MILEGRSVSRGGALVLVAGVAWLIFLSVLNPQRASVHGDGYYTYLWARTLVFDHDVDFANDYETCADPWGMASMPHGVAMNQWSPGAALFFVPVLLFDIATHHPALDSSDAHVSNGCIGALAERAVHGSVAAGILVLVLSFLAARRLAGDSVAAAAAVGAVLAGPVVYYATVMLSYGHAASAALGGLAVWAWLRERLRGESEGPTRGGWVLMGATLGLAMLARPQNAILVVLPLWHWIETAPWPARGPASFVRRVPSAAGGSPRAALLSHVGWGFAFVGGALATFGLQLYQWWATTGEVFLVPQGDYYLRPESPRIANLLFSSANGLFTWCPIAYLAVFGLVALAMRRRTRGLGLPLLLVLALSVWLNSCVADWWGAVGFAARRFDAMTVPFALGIAAGLVELAALTRLGRGAAVALASAAMIALIAMASMATISVALGMRSDVAQPAAAVWTTMTTRGQTGMWNAIGNPLAWPASIPFAIRYGVHPRLWDQASMPELFFHRWLTLETQDDLTTADLVGAHADLAVGFEPARPAAGGTYRFLEDDAARVFLPLSYPHLGGLRLEIAPELEGTEPMHVWLALDDEELGTFALARGQGTLEVPVRRPHQGITVLRLVTEGGTLGLARIEIRDRTPHPSVAQARRNARLRQRRIAWRREHGLPVPPAAR
ncbi:MAG: hypothetical protein OHK0013_44860 [Sandaracinaceae bacterium]